MARTPRKPRPPMFDDVSEAIDAAPVPVEYQVDKAEAVTDEAATGFRLMCLDRVIDFATPGARINDIITAAAQVRLFLLGQHPIEKQVAALASRQNQTQH